MSSQRSQPSFSRATAEEHNLLDNREDTREQLCQGDTKYLPDPMTMTQGPSGLGAGSENLQEVRGRGAVVISASQGI